MVLAQEEAGCSTTTTSGRSTSCWGSSARGRRGSEGPRVAGDLPEAVRSQVEEIIGQGQAAPTGHIPFTPRAKKVLELSLREALQLGHNYIGTEHILLGLIREGEGVAAQVLQKLGADLSRARQQVIQLLSGHAGATGQESEGPFPTAAGGIRYPSRRTGPQGGSGPGKRDGGGDDRLIGLIVAIDPDVDDLLRSWEIDPDAVRSRIEALADPAEEEEDAGDEEDES